MRFGTSFKKDDARPSAGSGITGFRTGETTIRFLEEMADWTKFYEHYNQGDKSFYPCTGDSANCPGCTAEDERERKAAKRYLSNALDVQGGVVRLYKIPSSLIAALDRRSDRDGTVTARDFTVFREGQGLSTSYDLEGGDKQPINTSRLELLDHQDALMGAFIEQWGSTPEELVERASPRRSAPRRREVKEETLPPTEPSRSSADEQEEVVRETDLRRMSLSELKGVYAHYGMSVPDALASQEDTTEVVDHLLMLLEEKAS